MMGWSGQLLAITASLALLHFAQAQSSKRGIITKDVCIIGGGASGTYAAVRLQDMGYDVVLIEREAQLGGHVNTYTDPQTGLAVDYGVAEYRTNISVVDTFFDRLGVAYGPFESPEGKTVRANLQTGQTLTNYTSPNVTDALARYSVLAAAYPELEYGYYLPDPVPEDLLMPFGQFVEKYNISGILPVVYRSYGNILEHTTLSVMKYFGPNAIQNLLTGFVGTTSHNNSEIYGKAARVLGENVLLQSNVLSVNRTTDGPIEVALETPSGQQLVRAGRLLVTIPPLLSGLESFDLDTRETSLFGAFSSVGYWTSLVQNTGLPNDTAVLNNDPSQPYNLPDLPGVYLITPTGVAGLYQVEYGSPTPLPDEVVKSDILSTIKRLKTTGVANGTDEPEFVEFKSHTPFQLTVPAEAVKSGFYKDLYALQGYRQTFYSGAAFHAYDSSLLWRFTEDLLPKVVNA